MEFINSEQLSDYDEIFITDISVNEEVAKRLDELNSCGYLVTLLDHHTTALWLQEEYLWASVCEELNGKKTSGTELIFDYLFGLQVSLPLCEIVQDITLYDSWRWMNDFETPYLPSKELNNLYYLLGRDKFVEEIMNGKTVSDFTLLLDIEKQRIERVINSKRKQLVKSLVMMDINGIPRLFGYVLSDTLSSEIGNVLCRENTDLDFIAVIDISGKGVSLRSIKDDIHLGTDIAKMFHGGGHAQASGCKLEGTWIGIINGYLSHE
jgi:oligoribonuclease NrnB/cAMP/cGMP phosphodiesterase (DHH superfamily)